MLSNSTIIKNKGPIRDMIVFIASKDFKNINFFQQATNRNPDFDFSHLHVFINDVLTSQHANSITAKANDRISISSDNGIYPLFGNDYDSYDQEHAVINDYVLSILTPFPPLSALDDEGWDYNTYNLDGLFYGWTLLQNVCEDLFVNQQNVVSCTELFRGCTSLTHLPPLFNKTNSIKYNYGLCYGCTSLKTVDNKLFAGCRLMDNFGDNFYNCTSLKNIPIGLFDDVTESEDVSFDYCFQNCSSLTEVPRGLFDKVTNATSFSGTFQGCSNLTTVPVDLLDKNTKVTYVNAMFNHCTSLTLSIQIGSTAETFENCDNFAYDNAAQGTVYCHAQTAVYQAFENGADTNVTLLTY